MSILTDVLSTVQGAVGTANKNRDAKLQYAQSQDLTNQQAAIAALLQKAGIAQANRGTNVTDPYGGGARYDPATGTWATTLAQPQQTVQDASYGEEAARLGGDQAIRRYGLGQADQLRQGGVGRAQAAGRSYDLFNQGVGQVDPASIAASMKLSRTGAVNAGYDDAMHAAGTMSLRTGTAAGDVFANLARNRANDIARTAGDPYTESLTAAQGINDSRRNNATSGYNLFNTQGGNFYDAQFNPSTYGQQATDNAFKSVGLQLDNFNAGTGASGNAAAILQGAGAGQRAAGQQQMANTNYFGGAQATRALGTSLDSAGPVASMLKKLGIG